MLLDARSFRIRIWYRQIPLLQHAHGLVEVVGLRKLLYQSGQILTCLLGVFLISRGSRMIIEDLIHFRKTRIVIENVFGALLCCCRRLAKIIVEPRNLKFMLANEFLDFTEPRVSFFPLRTIGMTAD